MFDESNMNYYGTTVLQHARLKEGECARVPLVPSCNSTPSTLYPQPQTSV